MNSFTRLLSILFFIYSQVLLSGQELISYEWKETRTFEELTENYGPFIRNGVNLYKVKYTTTDFRGQKDTASGLVALPEPEAGEWPLVVYIHGTINIRDSIPSNLSPEAQIPSVYSGVGSISIAPDLLGFGESRGFHPYLHAETEASAAADMLVALQALLAEKEMTTDGTLLIAGYSQGGHSAAAFHRLLETSYAGQFPVTGAAYMSGPYNLSGVTKERILGDEEYFFPSFVINILLSYNMVYGLYDDLSMLLKEPYVSLGELFFNGLIEQRDLNTALIETLTDSVGGSYPKLMLQDSVLENFQNNPSHPLQQALVANDVHDWAPQAAVQLIYCSGDDRVPPGNSLVAEVAMKTAGAPAVSKLDVGATLDHEQCVEPAALASILFFYGVTPVENIAGSSLPVRIYPNPLRSDLYVEGIAETFLLGIYDLNGRQVFAAERGGEGTISVPLLTPGMYLVRVVSRGGQWSGKIVVEGGR